MEKIIREVAGIAPGNRQELIKKYVRKGKELFFCGNDTSLYVEGGWFWFKKRHKIGYLDGDIDELQRDSIANIRVLEVIKASRLNINVELILREMTG